jgi:hypothetical protein
VKDIQANLPALKAEQRSLEAKTQANLVVEAIKKIKEGLEDRFDELNGIVDAKVRDVTSGKDGIDGKDGKNGVDGRDGKDGLSITGPKGADGEAGQDGVGVQDAYIDFDGSLIIKLTDGKEINVGEVVPMDVAEKIKIIGNGGGTSQSVLDAIAALQAVDATYGTMATQNANNVAITGGTINGTTVGATTPAAGTFTTLTATGQTSLGGAAGSESLRVLTPATAGAFMQVQGANASAVVVRFTTDGATNVSSTHVTRGTGSFVFSTNSLTGNGQFAITNTTSAVNYVQVTGAATGAGASALGGISFTGSDASPNFAIGTKGTVYIAFYGQGATNVQAFRVSNTNASSSGNLIQVQGAATGSAPSISAISGTSGTDADIDLTLTPKGTGTVRTSGTGVRLVGSTSGYVGLKGAAVAGSTTYTLPAADGTNGQVLATNGSATLSWATASGGGALAKQTDVFTSADNATYTAPANTQWVKVTCVGSGGSASGSTGRRCTGGGGGGVAIKWLAMTAGQTLTYTLLGGGAATVSSGSLTITTITGGAGGAGTTTVYANSSTSGPAGGTASGGDINITGGSGGTSYGSSTTVATNFSGAGGDSPGFGSGGSALGATAANGSVGTGYGGGGGGSHGTNNNASGAQGVIIFEAY